MATQAKGQGVFSAVPRCWQRQHNGLVAPEPRVPEPAQLYSLVVFYLQVHAPRPVAGSAYCRCASCGRAWPCASVRLAYRLREAF